jgi:hypothetical protein
LSWLTWPTARVITGIIVLIFLIALFHNEESSSALRPYLPSLPSQASSRTTIDRLSWLRDRMALSEKAWKKSVDERGRMAAQHPDYPKVPFFPTDFLSFPYTIWDFFPATWTCPHDFQRVGRLGDGGKWVCGMSIYESVPAPKFPTIEVVESREKALIPADAGIVIYSFGINAESSFEAEMLERVPSARIWGYDFSVEGWGAQIPTNQRHRTFFKKIGLGKEDKHDASPPFYTLPTLMKNNGHSYIDILKIDVEGSEFDALDTLMDAFDNIKSASGKNVIPIGQVMIEIHVGDGVDLKSTVAGGGVDFQRFRKWWERLEKMGMRPAWIEINLFAVTLAHGKSDPRCTEYVWVNARDERSVLWR